MNPSKPKTRTSAIRLTAALALVLGAGSVHAASRIPSYCLADLAPSVEQKAPTYMRDETMLRLAEDFRNQFPGDAWVTEATFADAQVSANLKAAMEDARRYFRKGGGGGGMPRGLFLRDFIDQLNRRVERIFPENHLITDNMLKRAPKAVREYVVELRKGGGGGMPR